MLDRIQRGYRCNLFPLSTFVLINFDDEWFNLEKREAVESEEISDLDVDAILNYAPNHKSFYFYFDVVKHVFFFEVYARGNRLSPHLMLKFLKTLFSHKKIEKKYGEIEMTIIPSVDKLNAILKMASINTLYLKIQRPNPDDHEEEEKAVLKSMDSQNVSMIEQNFRAIKGRSVVPDRKTRLLAKNSGDEWGSFS